MAALIGLFVGAFVGHMLWRDWGAALGGVAGFIVGAKLNALRKATGARPGTRSPASAPAPRDPITERERALQLRIAELERRVANLEARSATVTAEAPVAPQAAAPSGDATVPEAPRVGAIDSPPEPNVVVPVVETTRAPAIDVAPTLRGSPAASGANPIWTWFTGGNALTRIGVVVLFFGVAFLLRYFAEHFSFPIELRLAAVAACGLALIALGEWLARSRPGTGCRSRAPAPAFSI